MRSKFTKQVLVEQIKNLHPEAMVYLYETCFVSVSNILHSARISRDKIPNLLREFIIDTWFDIHRNSRFGNETDPEQMIEARARAFLKNKHTEDEDEMPADIGEALRPYVNLLPDSDKELLHIVFAENLSNILVSKHLDIQEDQVEEKIEIALQKLLDAFYVLLGEGSIDIKNGNIKFPEILNFLRKEHTYDAWIDVLESQGKDGRLYAEIILNAVVAVIKERRSELDHFIRNHAQLKLIKNNWGSSFTWISGIIIVIAILGYFLSGGQETKDQPISMVQRIADKLRDSGQVFSTKKDEFDLSESGMNTEEPGTTEAIYPEKIDQPVVNKTSEVELDSGFENDTVDDVEVSTFVVKKDILLKIITVKIIDKKSKLDTTILDKSLADLSQSTADKLNPDARLPERDKVNTQFVIELWKSPVNYKGYRGFRNRLILFGLEEAEWIRIYRFEEQYYLGYEPGTLYNIDLVNEFRPLTRVRDQEIIQTLLN